MKSHTTGYSLFSTWWRLTGCGTARLGHLDRVRHRLSRHIPEGEGVVDTLSWRGGVDTPSWRGGVDIRHTILEGRVL